MTAESDERTPSDKDSSLEESDTSAKLCIAVVTITSNGSIEEDEAGGAIVDAFEAAGHEIATRELIANDHDNVQSKISRLLDRDDVDIIVTTGGTGIEPDDVTVEAVDPLLEKELPAFVDLFHLVSYDEIGTSVVASRTLAGVSERIPVFCLPNNPVATRIASESIIIPEADRLTALANGNGRKND
ncbi:molybdenum cofactor biosynthesis protein B [Halostagnicola sp. A-GB9-2]|uniref:MogA/MoaB family molybdenum cofactor biosynthesis protein n=1 Tax=Halostagnicola sp. A-GB9-2 TaxID=3048066 RepID=UPI0024BF97C7|nr:molybdenum cofactor biosynthesis protein B [Halostagnicola sp. A-GB9-2]MDJ1430831.1 molybdenum cofactor biosynthesis protein B [Halostagnicola sp. A-GB9-2]